MTNTLQKQQVHYGQGPGKQVQIAGLTYSCVVYLVLGGAGRSADKHFFYYLYGEQNIWTTVKLSFNKSFIDFLVALYNLTFLRTFVIS